MKIFRINPDDPKPATHVMNFTRADLDALDEQIVRRMRDEVYGKPISDKEWENCKANWMRDRAWLENQVRQQQTKS